MNTTYTIKTYGGTRNAYYIMDEKGNTAYMYGLPSVEACKSWLAEHRPGATVKVA